MPELVSIIIPFYNEAAWLERAVRSALRQDYPSLEIVLVDDGSTDESPQIVQRLRAEAPGIVPVTIPNSGPGAARNAGLEKASGSYITFLDSDDELEPGTITSWIAAIGQADIVIGRFVMKHTGLNLERQAGWKGDGAAGSGSDGVCAMYEYRMASTVWAKLYKAAVVKPLRFPEGHWFEDRCFLLSSFLRAQSIVFDKFPALKVYSRQGSLTRRLLSPAKIEDAHSVYLRELDLVAGHKEHRRFTRLIDRHQINALLETMIILYFDKDQVTDRKALEQGLSRFIAAFRKRLRQNGTRAGLRDRLDLWLLRLHRYTGWPLVYILLPIWKRKKCRAVKQLKSF